MATQAKPAKRRGTKRAARKRSGAQRAPKRVEVLRPIPSLGRIVHYNTHGQSLAAIITQGSADWRGRVSLMVFGPSDSFRATDIPYSETPVVGTWSWPPQVEPTREIVEVTKS